MTVPSHCPHCGYSLVPREDAVASRLRELEHACQSRGLPVTGDQRVSEQVAAELLGRAPGTLANWAYGDGTLPYTKVSGRRTYRLADIAAFLESG